MTEFLCPVCGWPHLTEPPRTATNGGGSYEICPSCGFEFGFTDHALEIGDREWREGWKICGTPWSSVGIASPPFGWDPIEQLRSLPDDNDDFLLDRDGIARAESEIRKWQSRRKSEN